MLLLALEWFKRKNQVRRDEDPSREPVQALRDVRRVDDVNLEVEDGSLVALLGLRQRQEHAAAHLAGLVVCGLGESLVRRRACQRSACQCARRRLRVPSLRAVRQHDGGAEIGFGLTCAASTRLLSAKGGDAATPDRAPRLGQRYPHSSRRQRQRVALARRSHRPAAAPARRAFGAVTRRSRGAAPVAAPPACEEVGVTSTLSSARQEEAFSVADRVL